MASAQTDGAGVVIFIRSTCPSSVRFSNLSVNSSQTRERRTHCRCPPNGRLTDKRYSTKRKEVP